MFVNSSAFKQYERYQSVPEVALELTSATDHYAFSGGFLAAGFILLVLASSMVFLRAPSTAKASAIVGGVFTLFGLASGTFIYHFNAKYTQREIEDDAKNGFEKLNAMRSREIGYLNRRIKFLQPPIELKGA